MKPNKDLPFELNIQISRPVAVWLGLILLAAIVLGTLAWWGSPASAQILAPEGGQSGLRRYYLTTVTYNGDDADTAACTAGYHMASLWELYDTSNLEYNTSLGIFSNDMGQGPPFFGGWARTGSPSSGLDTPGIANCYNWTSSSDQGRGTAILLNDNWAADIGGWQSNIQACHQELSVWCVED
ncbi:hypothetical protein ACFLZW_04710 [Chloroflexota bacterium]